MPPPSNPRNSRTNYTPTVINPVKKPPAKKTNTPTITLPATPTITLPTTPTPTPTVSQPKINLSKSTEPKLTLPSYSGGFTSNQRNQPQTTANNNYSQEDNFLKKYPQVLLLLPLILIILYKK